MDRRVSSSTGESEREMSSARGTFSLGASLKAASGLFGGVVIADVSRRSGEDAARRRMLKMKRKMGKESGEMSECLIY